MIKDEGVWINYAGNSKFVTANLSLNGKYLYCTHGANISVGGNMTKT